MKYLVTCDDPSARVTVSYEAIDGTHRRWSGEDLPPVLEMVIRVELPGRRVEMRFAESLGRLFWDAARKNHDEDYPAAVIPSAPGDRARAFLTSGLRADGSAELRVCRWGVDESVYSLKISEVADD